MCIAARIREIRRINRLSQTAFGERLGVSRDVISNLENNRVEISGVTAKAICKEFRVSEEWLQTGNGKMFVDENAAMLDQLTRKYDLDNLDRKIIELYLRMPVNRRAIVKDLMRSMVDAVLDDDNYEDYREDYIVHNRSRVAARHGDASGIEELAREYDKNTGDDS